jgi:glycosyltransferase involved in cell wall biosynthesis
VAETLRADSGAPLRVLSVIARLNVGGPALLATVLSDRLDPTRFEQRIVAGIVGADEADHVALRAPHLQVQTIPGLGRSPRPTDDVLALGALIRVIRGFRPDIVHTHTAKAGVLGRLAAWSCGVPATVHTYHGHLLHGYFSPAVRRGVVLTERTLARKTTRLVAVGNQVRDDLVAARIGTPGQYTVVPPGLCLPPAPERAEARAILGLPATGPVVAFVARLTSIKRPERFLELSAALAQRHPDAIFVVVGGGALLDDLRFKAASAGLPIRFLGWRADVETVYAASDLVVLTSDNEGMPVSLIEASLAGRPCVTTRVGSAPEVVADGETGFVTDLSVAALADAVDRLLSDDALRGRMGRAAANRGRECFSAERLTRDIATLYEGVSRELGLGQGQADKNRY